MTYVGWLRDGNPDGGDRRKRRSGAGGRARRRFERRSIARMEEERP
jgi:hypothetical protein